MPDYKAEVPERYKISFNRAQGAFYILDMWHETVKNLPEDAPVPDNSPALKVLNSLEVNALVGELNKMGWLEKLVGKFDTADSQNQFTRSKSLQEVSIENIAAIVKADKNDGTSKEAILAIREIMNKI